jgi:hypothetical protein
LESMINFISVPALASGMEPPSYLTLYPLSPAKTISGIARHRRITISLFTLSFNLYRKVVKMARSRIGGVDCTPRKYSIAKAAGIRATQDVKEWSEVVTA